MAIQVLELKVYKESERERKRKRVAGERRSREFVGAYIRGRAREIDRVHARKERERKREMGHVLFTPIAMCFYVLQCGAAYCNVLQCEERY